MIIKHHNAKIAHLIVILARIQQLALFVKVIIYGIQVFKI